MRCYTIHTIFRTGPRSKDYQAHKFLIKKGLATFNVKDVDVDVDVGIKAPLTRRQRNLNYAQKHIHQKCAKSKNQFQAYNAIHQIQLFLIMM